MSNKDLGLPYRPPGPDPKPVNQSEFMDEDTRRSANGKPLGRPGKNRLANGMTLAAYARSYGMEVVEVLAEILQNPAARPSDRIAAGNTLLDRGFGKAVSVLGDETGEPVNLAQVLIGVMRPGQDPNMLQVVDHDFVSPPKPALPEAPVLVQRPEDLDPDA